MAGLGFAVDESSAFKNKQGKGQDLVGAIAGTDAVNKIAGSPAAATVGFLGEGATRGAALPIAATMDVLNKGVNAAGQFFGFNPGLSTDNTARVSNMSVPQSAAVPTTPPVNQAPAKAPAIAGPIAATTAAPKQQPVAPAPSTQQTVPAIAGIKQFEISKTIPSSGDTWRKGLDGKPYQVTGTNADGTRFDNDGFSRQMAADRKQAGIDAKYAMEVEASQKYAAAQKEAHNNRSLQQHFDDLLYSRNTLGMPEHVMWQLAGKNFAAQQDANKSRMTADAQKYTADQTNAAHKYTADQSLAGVKYTGDAHIKAADIAGESAVQRAKVGAIEKQQEAKNKSADQKQKDATALQQKVYDQITKGYDFTGISPTAVHDYATTMAKTAGKGYVTLADPTGTHGDVIVHPGVAAFANQHLKSVKTPDQYVRLLQELDKVAAGGIHRTGIKSTQQLKPLKVSPNQIAGMTTEQG